jgi:SPFH domain / Band 7 family
MLELIAVVALVLLALVVVSRAVRVVQQSTVGVVQRLGRYQRTLGPGVHLLVPGLDKIRVTVDMKETVQAFAPQPVITEDNVTIGVDTVAYYQVTDAVARGDAHEPRRDQLAAAHRARRGHREVERAGHTRRAQEHRPAPDHPGSDGAADAR